MEFMVFFVVLLMAVPTAIMVKRYRRPVRVSAVQPRPVFSLESPLPKKVRYYTRNGGLMTARVVTASNGHVILRRAGHPNGPCFRRPVTSLQ